MIDLSDFLDKYRIDREKFKACGLGWNELSKIATDYKCCLPDLEPTAKYIADCLSQVDEVHSLKIRLKDPEHLIEKIIRKKFDDSSLNFSLENYRNKIPDLIGIRALHLFKADWMKIHDFITGKFELCEKPIANIRKGDSESFVHEFRVKGCEIKEHKFGYRSVHYLVQSQPARGLHMAEIQLRTIFEEGWSEIDHRIRYPYDTDNPILNQYLFMFNRLAGSADEMGSFVRLLKCKFEELSRKAQGSLEEKDKAIRELRDQVKNLKIEKRKKDKIEAQIEALSKFVSATRESNVIANLPDSLLGLSTVSSDSVLTFKLTAQKCSRCGKDIIGPLDLLTYPLLCSECRA
jgi:putative GTP pyrophosphokinase